MDLEFNFYITIVPIRKKKKKANKVKSIRQKSLRPYLWAEKDLINNDMEDH